MSTEKEEWLSNLKPGDEVGVYELRGTRLVYKTKVARRTPSGRIVCKISDVDGDDTFRPDGFLYASRSSCYADRQLGPLPDQHDDARQVC